MNIQDIFLHTLRALDQRDPRAAATAHESKRAEQEGSPPTDGARTAGAIDPNYCSRCTPKGYGCCRCEIACNE